MSNIEREDYVMKKWKCTVCSYQYSAEEKPEKCPACGVEAAMLSEIDPAAVE